MQTWLQFIKRIILLIISYFPSALPLTKEEFESFYNSLLFLFKFDDTPQFKHAVATGLMHIDSLTIKKPKRYFERSLKKAQVNDTAFNVIQDILKKEKETIEAAKKLQEAPIEPPQTN